MSALLLIFASPSDALEIRLGHNAPANDPRHQALRDFAERVSQLSAGELRVKIFPGNTIGQDRERLELMQAGLLEMSLTGEILANFDARWSIISMPYIWTDQAHLRRFLQSDIVRDWRTETARTSGLQVLGFFERSPRILTTRETPVRKISDLGELRVRVPQIPAYMDTWRAFGVVPTPMSSSEFYRALETGDIDGMENPIEVMSAWRIHKVSTYLSFTEHMRTALFLVASDAFWTSLSSDQRAFIEQAASEAAVLHAERTETLVQTLTDNLVAKGMIIIPDLDVTGFRDAAQDVHTKYMGAFGREVYDYVQAIAVSETD